MADPDTLRALLDVRRATADLQGRCALPARQRNRRLLSPPRDWGALHFAWRRVQREWMQWEHWSFRAMFNDLLRS